MCFSFILFCKTTLKENLKYQNFFKIFFVLIILFTNIFNEKILINKNKNQLKEIQNIQEFIEKNNLINSNKKLFTDDRRIMNLWLLNGNKQLVISDGFTNSLKNNQIEFNLLNNLKNFEISESDLKKILSLGKSTMRDDFFMTIFNPVAVLLLQVPKHLEWDGKKCSDHVL